MKKIISILAFTLISAVSLMAQTVEGHVYDETSREPLIGASVIYIVRGETMGTSTDAAGYYRVEVPDGGTNLVFSYLGYEDVTVPVVVNARETATRDIYMKAEVQLLQNVVVSAGRYEQKLSELTVSMDVLDRNTIQRQIPTDLTDVLAKLPSVDVTDNQPSIRGGAGWTYGVGSRALVLVDGMSVLGAATGSIAWNIVPMENIEQVEVLKGASSVLYGSSALNGLINVRTGRPGLVPKTNLKFYAGIYGNPSNEDYIWWDKDSWKDGKFEVKPFLRNSVFSGVRNPMYEGIDMSHSRRIGNFDVNLGLNFLTDEGYRDQGYRKRFRLGGNVTYHQPHQDIMNYGVNYNFMTDKYGDFLVWRSIDQPLQASAVTTMGREGNTFNIDPFFNYVNTRNNTAHRFKGRFQYEADNISSGSQKSLQQILGNMGTDYQGVLDLVNDVSGIMDGDLGWITSVLPNLAEGDLQGILGWGLGELNKVFPKATTADYIDLIGFLMSNGIPLGDSSELIPWLVNATDPQPEKTLINKNYTYYMDYQFNKKIGDAQFTVGTTYHHVTNKSEVTGLHESDNISLFFQYDHRFWDRLSVSLGARAEYYRVDEHKKEAKTKLFGSDLPFKPVFRGGLNYQLAEYTFLRGSFGQGYRYPSLTEKYARKDIGGAGVFPNKDLKAETSINAEIGLIQGYKIGPFQGFIDIAGFYTYYKNMIEFRLGFFEDFGRYKQLEDVMQLVMAFATGNSIGLGANFYNVDRARIYGVDVSTNGTYNIAPGMKFLYNLGYVYTEPLDPDYKKKNEIESGSDYDSPLKMKEKSNTSKYLKYRQKHTFKASIDFEWNRFTVGTNVTVKSRTLAVDYIFLDERPRENGRYEIMDYVRDILFGHNGTENFASYWERTNKAYALWDLRMGVKASDALSFQVSLHNVMNKEYQTRPMALGQPRTYVFTVGYSF